MKVLVTGSSGLVGSITVKHLLEHGYEVVPYDLAEGCDILDIERLEIAAASCGVIVHLAAMDEPDNSEIGPRATGTAETIVSVNVEGTKNILSVAQKNKVGKVVVLSSVDVFGVFMGKDVPDYLPLDDEHPLRPHGPYAESKVLVENLCEAFTLETGIPTACLRPPGIFVESTYKFIRAKLLKNPEIEWSPMWEYGAFIDARDVAHAILRSIGTQFSGHHRMIICADDILSANLDTISLVKKLLPDVEWRGGIEYEKEPFKALLDSTRAKKLIGFSPRYKWR